MLSTNDIVTQLQTLFRYMEGDVSLYEATNQMLASGSECTETTLRELLMNAPRFNVHHLREDTKHGEADEWS